MRILRRILIPAHRYLGIALSLLLVVLFASGIVMMYAGGMPRVLPELRLERRPALDLAAAKLTPADAAERAGAEGEERALLLTVMERPAYRFGAGRPVTVFADNGETLGEISVEQSREIVGRFAGRPVADVQYLETLTRVDLVAGRRDPNRLLISAETLAVRHEPFSADSLMARLRDALPDAPIVEHELLSAYDSYYYSRGRQTPLPILRVKFGDPAQTWVYVDPEMSQVVATIHRVERWLYNGLHSLDFAFWYDSVAWDVGMIALCLGGLASSGIGLLLGLHRMQRGVRAMFPLPRLSQPSRHASDSM